ncbi:RloG [Salmonella phage 40]|nr:RloG [Salmonella phage 40]
MNSSPVYLIQNNYIDKDTDDQNPVASRRPEKALEVLERLIEDRQLVTLVTEDKIIENYILTSMEASRSNSDGAALVFQLEFTEFRTFTLGKTALATVYSDPKKSGGKTKAKRFCPILCNRW